MGEEWMDFLRKVAVNRSISAENDGEIDAVRRSKNGNRGGKTRDFADGETVLRRRGKRGPGPAFSVVRRDGWNQNITSPENRFGHWEFFFYTTGFETKSRDGKIDAVCRSKNGNRGEKPATLQTASRWLRSPDHSQTETKPGIGFLGRSARWIKPKKITSHPKNRFGPREFFFGFETKIRGHGTKILWNCRRVMRTLYNAVCNDLCTRVILLGRVRLWKIFVSNDILSENVSSESLSIFNIIPCTIFT